jgi:hypothetical protein
VLLFLRFSAVRRDPLSSSSSVYPNPDWGIHPIHAYFVAMSETPPAVCQPLALRVSYSDAPDSTSSALQLNSSAFRGPQACAYVLDALIAASEHLVWILVEMGSAVFRAGKALSGRASPVHTPATRPEINGKEQCYMRIFKLIGTLVLVLASSAIAVLTASAAETLWRLLPGSAKETFTGKSGKIQFEYTNGIRIFCAKSMILLTFGVASSELLENEAKLALALLRLEGCKAEGVFSFNSVGDAKETVLVHLEIHLCMVKPGDFGLLIKILPVTLEGFILGSAELSGAFIALVSPLATTDKKHFELNIKQNKGIQEIDKCEGGEKWTLTAKINAEPAQSVGVAFQEFLFLFDGTINNAGEEMMEK